MKRWMAGVAALGIVASVLVVAQPASADQIRDREYWLADYGISQAWLKTKGAGVTVAVIDTGIDASQPDLMGAVVGGTDVSGIGSANGQKPVGTDSGHGTMVASLLAGRGHGDGAGVIGVAPKASLLSISVGFGGVGTTNSDEQIAKAVRWAVDNGASVINMSLTRNTLDWPTSWDDAFLYAMQHDVVIVAAAGNRGSGTTEVGAPATMPGVVTVAGVDRNGKASFDASSQGITISVAAPSEQLVGVGAGGGYYEWAGTSGATPIVAGLVALIRSAYPNLDANNVINRLIKTAKPVGSVVPSNIYGYGLIDARAAVTATVAKVAANPMGDLADWIRLYRRAAASPSPTPSPSVAPPNSAPTPSPVAAQANPLGTILPTVTMLRDVGIPLIVFVGFGGAFVLAAIGAGRHFRRVRRK
jgi:type VII secretion-associated serine protease mycosin